MVFEATESLAIWMPPLLLSLGGPERAVVGGLDLEMGYHGYARRQYAPQKNPIVSKLVSLMNFQLFDWKP